MLLMIISDRLLMLTVSIHAAFPVFALATHLKQSQLDVNCEVTGGCISVPVELTLISLLNCSAGLQQQLLLLLSSSLSYSRLGWLHKVKFSFAELLEQDFL